MSRLVAATVAFLLTLAIGSALSLVSDYARITGYATVGQSVVVEIVPAYSDVVWNETTNSTYVLWEPYQGDVKWVELKVYNHGSNVSLFVNATVVSGDPSSVNITLWNMAKNETLSNPYEIKSGRYEYVYLKHEIDDLAEPGNYTFAVSVGPV